MIKHFYIFITLILLQGCATTPSGPRFSAIKNEPGVAVLYIYRLHTPPLLRKPDIKVNDVVVAELPVDSYTVVKLNPGEYSIKSDWGIFDGFILNRTTSLSVVAGKSYFVNFAGQLELTGLIVMPAVVSSTVTSGAIAQSGGAIAIPPELINCSLVPPKVQLISSQ